MVILLVLAFIVLLVAVPLVIDNRDLLLDRLHGIHGPRGLRGRDRELDGEPELPFLIIPITHHDADHEAEHDAGLAENDAPWQPARDDSNSRWADPAHITTYAPAASAAAAASSAPSAAPSNTPFVAPSTIATPDEVPEQDIRAAQTVVFRHPSDEPVQILPGRLEVVAGEPARDDLRFFGQVGEPVRITLGREAGSPQRVITLRSPTVSRRHARMDFVDGRWQITNLSKTNPVLVNDRMVAPDGSVACVLAEGDRIELGEVVLRFHER